MTNASQKMYLYACPLPFFPRLHQGITKSQDDITIEFGVDIWKSFTLTPTLRTDKADCPELCSVRFVNISKDRDSTIPLFDHPQNKKKKIKKILIYK